MEADFDSGAALEEAEQRRTTRVKKLAYRAPGAISVPAQPSPAEIGWRGGEGSGLPPAAEPASAPAPVEDPRIAALEERLRALEGQRTAENERLLREGREAVESARLEAERQGNAALDRMAQQVTAALNSFHREREEYFARVEREVVQLALAVAARILHREALLDPLLLAGAVRVALGQLGETTGVRLHCPAEQAETWRERLAGLTPAPEVAADSAMAPGECVIEARVGSVDLGVRAQLEEIERGFFDLLEQRPGAANRAPVA